MQWLVNQNQNEKEEKAEWAKWMSAEKACMITKRQKATVTTVITGGDCLVLTYWPLGAANVYLMQIFKRTFIVDAWGTL